MKQVLLFFLIFLTINSVVAQEQSLQGHTEQINYMYAPWRAEHKEKDTSSSAQKSDCIFCAKFDCNCDETLFVLKRYKHHAVMLNLYPYNPGHLLIVPFEHTANLEELSSEARIELMELITFSIKALKSVLKTEGINVGINMGKAAGASVPNHLHIHLVPRFFGDTAFFPVTTNTIVCSFDLAKIFEKLKKYFEA